MRHYSRRRRNLALICAMTFIFACIFGGCGKSVMAFDSINEGREQIQKLQYRFSGKLELADLFQSGMMPCADRPFQVWGLCQAGEKLTLTLTKEEQVVQVREGTAASDHSFCVAFDPVPASGEPYALKIRAGQEEILLEDILFGLLFLAGGQSNMEFKLNACRDGGSYAQENAGAAVRFYQTQPLPLEGAQYGEYPFLPQFFGSRGSWGRASDTVSALSASAVAFSFACELSKATGLPVGFVDISVGGSTLESWLPRSLMEGELSEAAARRNKLISPEQWNQAPENMNQMSANHNLKVSPLDHAVFSGVIWYQGESNISDSGYDFFEEGTKALVGYLAECSGYEPGTMPFVSVQLAPYAYFENDQTRLPKLWESQESILDYPMTALIPIYDLPTDYADHPIHPIVKLPVGSRTALSMQALIEGKPSLARAPRAISASRLSEGGILIQTQAENLVADGAVQGFEMAGRDGKFYAAEAELSENLIFVTCTNVQEPFEVRYNYHQTDREGNVTDGRFLLLPFSMTVEEETM